MTDVAETDVRNIKSRNIELCVMRLTQHVREACFNTICISVKNEALASFWYLQCESTPPQGFLPIFRNGWEFLVQILRTLFVPIYAGLQIFIQLSAILTNLCHIKHDHPVHTVCSKCPPSADMHAGIIWHFPQTVWNFFSKFYTPIAHSYLR